MYWCGNCCMQNNLFFLIFIVTLRIFFGLHLKVDHTKLVSLWESELLNEWVSILLSLYSWAGSR